MNPKEFFDKVSRMRKAHKEYFRTRSGRALSDSKRLEKEIDDEIDREQWFVVDDGFEEEMVCSKSEVDYDYILSCYGHRKATAEEIVEYFKKK